MKRKLSLKPIKVNESLGESIRQTVFEMEKIIIDNPHLIQHYHNDFWYWDRNKLYLNYVPGTSYLWSIRTTGTWLTPIQGTEYNTAIAQCKSHIWYILQQFQYKKLYLVKPDSIFKKERVREINPIYALRLISPYYVAENYLKN
jgi:hypothetical protein